jgi:Domain of unknown function (DUF6531)
VVALVSRNSLGVSLSSLATLGGRGVFGSAAHGRANENAFVNLANGNLVLQGRDENLVGRGLQATAVRTYNSQGLLNDDNGDNWSFAQQVQVSGTLNTVGSTITRTDRDGAQAIYTWSGSVYVSKVRGSAEVIHHGNGSLSLIKEGGSAFDTITYELALAMDRWCHRFD